MGTIRLLGTVLTITAAAGSLLLLGPVTSHAFTAQTQEQVGQPVTPPETLKAPPDLRNPENPQEAAKDDIQRNPNRIDPALSGRSTPPSRECEGCQLLRAKVLGVQENTLFVRDPSKKEIRLTLNKETIRGQENPKYGGFMEGDRIEAYVRPDGQVHSISVLQFPKGRPGPEDLGD